MLDKGSDLNAYRVRSLGLVWSSKVLAVSSKSVKGITLGSHAESLVNTSHIQVSISCCDGVRVGIDEKQPLRHSGIDMPSSGNVIEWVEVLSYDRCIGTSSTIMPLVLI